MTDSELAPRTKSTLEEGLLGGTLVWVTLSVLPVASPWPTVPTKQLGLLIGAVLLVCVTVLRSGAQVTAVLRAAPMLVRIALGSLWAWIFWQFLRIAGSPMQDVYEGIWGTSTRGTGALTKLALAVLATAWVALPSLAGGWALLRALRVTVACVGVYSTLQAFGIDFTKWDIDSRYVGVFGNVNHASSFYAFASMVLVALLLAPERWTRRERLTWFDGVLLVWMLALCLRTAIGIASRQGLFLLACGMAAMVLSYGYTRWREDTLARRKLLLLLAGAVLVGGTGATQLVRIDNGASDRLAMWSTGVAIARAHPLRGIGVSQLPYHYQVYQTQYDAMSGNVFRHVDEIHSGPLQQADELGIPGLVVYLCFFAAMLPLCFFALAGADRVAKAAAAGWLIYAIQETFSPFSLVISAWGFACAGVILASYRLQGQARAPYPAAAGAGETAMVGRRWLVAMTIVGIAAWGLVPRITSEFKYIREWNVGLLNDGSESLIRVRLQLRNSFNNLERIVALRPYDYEMREAIAFAAGKNAEPTIAQRIVQESFLTKPNVLKQRDFYAEIELARGNLSTALAQYEIATVQFPRSLWLALRRRIAADYLRDPAKTAAATAHLDSLGSMFRVSVDSMQILKKRVHGGMKVTAQQLMRP